MVKRLKNNILDSLKRNRSVSEDILIKSRSGVNTKHSEHTQSNIDRLFKLFLLRDSFYVSFKLLMFVACVE